MIITIRNVHDLTVEQAEELADNLVCDEPRYHHMLEVQGPYAIIEEFWPSCADDVRELLEQLIDLESNYSG